MKRLSFRMVSLILVIFLAACNNNKTGGKPVELKFNMGKGEKFDYTMNMDMGMEQNIMGQNMKMKNSMSFTYLFEVLGDSAGWKTMAGTIQNIKADIDAMGMSIHVDTDKPSADTTGPMGMMHKVFHAMKGQQFSFTMNEKGEVGQVNGIKEMQEKMMETVPGADAEGPMTEGFDEESFRQNIQQSFAVYPGKPVKTGESWTKTMMTKNQGMDVKSENTYTLESVKGNDAIIRVDSKLSLAGTPEVKDAQMDMTGKSNGIMHYDLPSGMVTDGNIDMDMDMRIKTQGKEMPMKMKMKMTMKGEKK